MKKLIIGLILLSGVCFAQVPVKTVDGNGKERITAASGVAYDSGMVAVTNSATTLTATTTTVQVIHCLNSTAGAVTLTITDNAGSPITYFPAVSMAANSVLVANYGTTGLPYAGVKLTAGSNSAITCRFIGVQ